MGIREATLSKLHTVHSHTMTVLDIKNVILSLLRTGNWRYAIAYVRY